MRFFPGMGATMRTFCASASARSSASAATLRDLRPGGGRDLVRRDGRPREDVLDLADDAVVGQRLDEELGGSVEDLLVDRDVGSTGAWTRKSIDGSRNAGDGEHLLERELDGLRLLLLERRARVDDDRLDARPSPRGRFGCRSRRGRVGRRR